MQELAEFLKSLYSRGVRFWVQGGQLHYRDVNCALDSGDMSDLVRLKEEIVLALTEPGSAPIDLSDADGASIPKALPMTFQQLWLWNLLGAYAHWNCVNVFAFRLLGRLDTDALRKGVEELVRRHDALRTRITLVDGRPHQRVDETAAFRMEELPFKDERGAERDLVVSKAVNQFLNRRTDLCAGPLFNVGLMRVSEQVHVLAVSVHHIVTDGFSQALLFKELWLLYGAFSRNQASPLPEAPAQYATYAKWQHETHQAWIDSHEAYWKARLSGATCIRFPSCVGIPGATVGDPGSLRFSFDSTLSAGARELAGRTRTPLPLVMVSVYVTAVFKRCGQFDFVVPFNVSGRHLSMHKDMVGYLAYFLYLRIALTGGQSALEILDLVSREFFTALEHQDFGRKVAEMPELLFGGPCQWLSWGPDELDGLPVSDVTDQLEIQIERFRFEFQGHLPMLADFGIQFSDTGHGISVDLGYCADRFSAASMEQFARDLQDSLERLVRSPDSPTVRVSNGRKAGDPGADNS